MKVGIDVNNELQANTLYFVGSTFIRHKKTGKIKFCRFFEWLDPDKNVHQVYFDGKESGIFIAKTLACGGYERPHEITMLKLKKLMFNKDLDDLGIVV